MPEHLAGASIKDPRLQQPLPWAGMRRAMPELFLSSIVSLLLVILPGAAIRLAVRRRRWSLLWLMAWPAGFAVLFAALRLLAARSSDIAEYVGRLGGPLMRGSWVASDALASATGLVLLAIQGLPIVLFAGVLLMAIVDRSWQRLARWLIVFMIPTVSISVLILAIESQHLPTPHHYYSWEGWYWMWFHGAYLTGILAGLTYLLGPPLRRLKQWFL